MYTWEVTPGNTCWRAGWEAEKGRQLMQVCSQASTHRGTLGARALLPLCLGQGCWAVHTPASAGHWWEAAGEATLHSPALFGLPWALSQQDKPSGKEVQTRHLETRLSLHWKG